MTATFVPLLLKSHDPRLLFLASGTSTLTGTENPNAPINKVPAAGWPKTGGNAQTNIPAYRSAKCGMNMMMRGASKRVYTSSPKNTLTVSFPFARMAPHPQRRRRKSMVPLARFSRHRARRQPRGSQESWSRRSRHRWSVCEKHLGRAERWRRRSRAFPGRCAAVVSSSGSTAKSKRKIISALPFLV